MLAPWLLSILPATLLFAAVVKAELKPYITTEAEYNTECKTCPHSLCPNTLDYTDGDAFNVTCWTRGTKIMGDRLWLKNEAGCYITQYDVIEYLGDYTTDLAYCGSDSEEENLTIQDATTKYKTECRICPELDCDTITYLKEDTDLELTCWYPDGQVIIDDPYWMKTTNNCYVAQKNLYSKPDITYLDPCGPVPYLEPEKHNNENGTSDNDKRSPTPVPDSLRVQYLVNVTVGEDNAHCRNCPHASCKTEKVYKFDQQVWLQCVTDSGLNGTAEWWSETTDFCYVKDTEFWESPEGDYYRMPLCEYFDVGGPTPDPDNDSE